MSLETAASIGAILTPIIVIVLSGIGWIFANRIKTSQEQEREDRRLEREESKQQEKMRLEREEKRLKRIEDQEQYWRELENKLRDDRIQTYNQILEPFIFMLAGKSAYSTDKNHRGKDLATIGQEIILNVEYKKYSFKLALMGSDDVCKAYNELMQFFYKAELGDISSNEKTKKFMSLLGGFLLEIRKGMGNENTKLSNFEMLEWLIKDIENYRE